MIYDPIGDDEHTDADERARIVAWLRERAKQRRHGVGYGSIGDEALMLAADIIERGGHYLEEP